jgi:hypothetical protein
MASEEDRRLAQRRKPVSGSVEDYAPDAEDKDAPSEEDIARFSDVTVKCKGCGTELFDDVRECWKCGLAVGRHSHETGLPTWIVLTALGLLVLVAIWFIF